MLTLRCWCKDCPRTCLVFVIGRMVGSCVPGQALFGGTTAHEALGALRLMPAALETPERHWCHDIRRGRALDLQCAGGGSVF